MSYMAFYIKRLKQKEGKMWEVTIRKTRFCRGIGLFGV